MLESAETLFEFETKQKGALYRLRLVRFARLFWLQRVDLEDWLASIQDELLEMQAVFHEGTEAQLESLTVRNVQKHNLARAIPWGEDKRVLLVWQSRQHSWFDSQTKAGVSFTSQVAWHKSPFWTTPGEVFRQQFAQEWQNPDCDARDALEYLLASPEEQRRRALVWLRGGWEEPQHVLGAALKLEFDEAITLSHAVNNYDLKLEWVLFPPDSWTPKLPPAYPGGFTPPDRLQRLLSIIDERNVWDTTAFKSNRRGGLNEDVAISTPSMHDKMEARHFLLGWLREHAPHLVPDWV